jgi:3-dehydroquinate synthase
MIRIDTLGYLILIGALETAVLPATRLFLVTDENVASAGWPDRLGADFAGRFVLPPGEGSKTLATVERLLGAMIDSGIGRADHVVAVGGGVTGDVAGLAAALLKRGCNWIAVPTSLLAQADSAVGGKTGVDAPQGKNLIGAFHAPSLVLIDPDALSTLPEAELRAGYAEVVKYGLIADPGFFAWCEANGAALIAGDAAARRHAIETCVRAKAALVAGDERDTKGQRALLNFGHSFGHAIEAETGMRHGEAVAIGMAMALRLSVERGLCPPEDADRAIAHLEAVGLPTQTDVDPERVAERMAHDKKGAALVLSRGIGKGFLENSQLFPFGLSLSKPSP